jgi:hypothetical protein
VEFEKLLKWRGQIFLNEYIDNPNQIFLSILIDRAIGGTYDNNIDDSIAYRSSEIDKNSSVLKLDFDSYVANQVTGEHYSTVDDYEISKGYNFRIITRSKYLDYIRDNTSATQINPELKLLHYQVVCSISIIDIVTFHKPIISEIERRNLAI